MTSSQFWDRLNKNRLKEIHPQKEWCFQMRLWAASTRKNRKQNSRAKRSKSWSRRSRLSMPSLRAAWRCLIQPWIQSWQPSCKTKWRSAWKHSPVFYSWSSLSASRCWRLMRMSRTRLTTKLWSLFNSFQWSCCWFHMASQCSSTQAWQTGYTWDSTALMHFVSLSTIWQMRVSTLT